MGRNSIPTDTWPGTRFANGWEIIRRISREEESALGMGTHNAHFECYNHNCGVTTCIEKTTLNTYLTQPRDVLYNCRKCDPNNCKYKDKVRKQVGRDKVTADYSHKVEIGNLYGDFEVIDILDSTKWGGHQKRAIVRCVHCGRERECLFHHLTNTNVACECSKNHSIGEVLVKHYLDNNNIPYKTEYVFDELRGLKGGILRYDFGILDNKSCLKALIEFDGEQHFNESGTYMNEDGQVQKHDQRKNEYAAAHNIPLLRIPYDKKAEIPNIINNFLQTC